MSSEPNWILRVLRFITKEEVKTPLSFLYKVLPYLVGALIVILYAPISDDLKLKIVGWTLLSLLGLAGVVMLFAWCRPKHLVYGETGHRAEHKIEFGSDNRPLLKSELDVMPAESNPELPRIERR